MTANPASTATRPRQRRPHRGQPRPLRDLSRFLRVLGPGLITGAADDDPSGIATYSQTGASFGYGQLWLALYMLPLMIAVQEMCGRIGLVTGQGIAGVVRTRYPRQVLLGAVVLVLVANTINVGADLGAMAASAQLLVPVAPFGLLVVVFAVGILLLEVFIPYRHYARILKVLTLALLAYIATGIIIAPDWRAVLSALFVPVIQPNVGFLLLVVAVLGTTISPYLFFWQASEEVEEEILHNHDNPVPKPGGPHLKQLLRGLRVDTTLGMLASEVTTFFIIVTTAGTIHLAPGSKTITTADQAASALVPLVHTFPNAGEIAKVIFALGILGTGLLAVPVLAGSAAYGVSEALGWREGLYRPLRQARGFYGVIAVATLVGLLLNVFGVNAIQALVYTAIINGIVAVPLLVLILLVANNRAIMGEHTNGLLSNAVGILTTVAMAVAAVAIVASLWIH
jgi:NRAMP (natural resistance-associated macrophage protein)-like metal ion transporter